MIHRLLFVAALLTGVLVLRGSSAEPPRIVFMIGEEGYRTSETLPEFAETELTPRGYRFAIVGADPVDQNHFPALIAELERADLLFVSVRRRTPPKAELAAVRAYLAAGKPMVGIRTACHAFALRPNEPLASPVLAAWPDFDPEVIGGHYSAHLGKGEIAVSLAPGAETQSILQGLEIARLVGHGGMYKVSPLAASSVPLLMGTVPEQPSEPIAWTHRYGEKKGRIFYTSLGHPDDFKNPEFRKLLVNAIDWALSR